MRLSDEKLAEIMVSAGENTPLMAAFEQILSDQLENEVHASLLSDLDSNSRAYNCGRAASIKDLRSYIQDLRGPTA